MRPHPFFLKILKRVEAIMFLFFVALIIQGIIIFY